MCSKANEIEGNYYNQTIKTNSDNWVRKKGRSKSWKIDEYYIVGSLFHPVVVKDYFLKWRAWGQWGLYYSHCCGELMKKRKVLLLEFLKCF